jgi:hypothetical protein
MVIGAAAMWAEVNDAKIAAACIASMPHGGAR